MSSSRSVQVWPVIQATSVDDVLRQAEHAAAAGVDGVFLINHDADHALLVTCLRAVSDHLPALALGANVIRQSPVEALTTLHAGFGGAPPITALWTDDAQVSSELGPERSTEHLDRLTSDIGWSGTHFGGVAFKYQAFVPDEELPALGRLARQWVDVPTTSGPGTGQAIGVRRLELLRSGLGEHPLALASGVSAENIDVLAPFVTHVLVSTSISTDGSLDPAKLRELLARL